jgi:hypothetical protein
VPETEAFYEPFNEGLANLTEEDARKIRPGSWDSGHPDAKPYFTEYLPMFRDAGSGVRFADPAFAYELFFPAAGEDGSNASLSDGEKLYLGEILKTASPKRAVFAFTRSLGRIPHIRSEFGGVHIFLYRSLFDQWLSYLRQYQGGNPYFVQTVASILKHAHHTPLHAPFYLALQCTRPEDSFAGFGSESNTFTAFLGLHLYLYGCALVEADVVIDASRCASEPDYRARKEAEVRAASGIAISLKDADRNFSYTPHVIDPSIVENVQNVVLGCRAWSEEQANFIRSLANEMLATDRKYQRLVQGVLTAANLEHRQTLQHAEDRYSEQKALAESRYSEQKAQAESMYRALEGEYALLQEENKKASDALAELRVEHAELRRDFATAEAEIASLESRISLFLASSSWRLTRPLRAVGNLLRQR